MTESTSPSSPPIILLPGYWLGAWAWDDVVVRLTESGHDAKALTLPGSNSVDEDRGSVRFSDHVEYVAEQVLTGGRVVLVAHSGSGAVATAVADRLPDALARIVYVDSGPVADGQVPRPDLDTDDADLPFPGLDTLAEEGASTEGLTASDRARFEARAVPQASGACREPIRLSGPRRNSVPATLICCSIPRTAVREMAASGAAMFAPVNDLTDVTFIDLPTGHWPMFSRATELADIIGEQAERG